MNIVTTKDQYIIHTNITHIKIIFSQKDSSKGLSYITIDVLHAKLCY